MEATQESTQPCADPRRMGMNNSGIQDQDLADIICILHPNSHAAHDAVGATGELRAQHILQRDILEHESSHTAALDLALRLSSKVHSLAVGFCFGRNRSRCDILLSVDDDAKRVSNTHFRIYLTEDGILMLQDTSTNGTIVDNCRLRKSLKDGNSRMLTNGSVIQVITGSQASDEVRFVVRIPSREGFAVQYHQNLFRYFERVHAHTPAHKERQGPSALAWSSANAYGMHWTGGAEYNVTGQIGKGAFATVYKIATKQHGAIYAAKELDKRRFMKNGILDQKVDNEMKIMRDLTHPNIVQYINHHEHDRWIYIIMEYVPGGELSTYLQTQGRIAEEMVRTIARQVLRALHYLHKRRITHRDIKPDNILIASLDPLRIKLSDFGLSKVVEQETFLKTFCGTLLYCAPEVYPDYDQYRRGELRKRRRVGDPPPKTSPYSQSVDMWSLGAVLFHILSGVPPYSGRAEDRGVQMLRTIMTCDADFDALRKVNVSESGIDFVAKLLNRDPFSRPTEKECFQHPWVAEVPDVDEYEDDDDLLYDHQDGLSVIGEDAEDELDASQLSITEGPGYVHEADGEEGSGSEEISKRPRTEYTPTNVRYPSLPNIESFHDGQAVVDDHAKRLFGEVSASALRSSHALGNMDAYDASNFNVDFLSSDHSWAHQKRDTSYPQVPTPKAKFTRRINLALAIPDTASEASSDNSAQSSRCNTAAETPSRSAHSEYDPEFATTLDAQTGQAILDQARVEEPDSSEPIVHRPKSPPLPFTLSDPEFAKPPKRFGKLKSLPGSIFDLTIYLEDRLTSWGRGPLATIKHADPMDTRIPAYALEVTFWTPGIEARIAAGESWLEIPGVMAILSTKARSGIWVNDTLLRRGSMTEDGPEALQYGKLYTGDIITVYQNKDRSKFLKLQCDFTHGESSQPRPGHEAGFMVRQALMAKTSRAANRMPIRPQSKDRDQVEI
ncbi:Serine/threonine-protein kinase RAD53 [Penicillium digitatum]|uniref:Serine/threonine-protein kinase RAD53 n=1 Tax=Penicillium digitatum TaxID=36651 RepID=A0A7T7BPL5_PENDI|nr:Serine/threonine-protein kinase RAD53 [Penicillium digitatum]